jgi:hypothetical protein
MKFVRAGFKPARINPRKSALICGYNSSQLNWQAAYDLHRARKEHAKDYREIKTATAA